MAYIRQFSFKIITFLFIFYSLGTGLFHLGNLLKDYPDETRDDVSTWETRLKVLKNEIPQDQLNISYVSDWDVQGYNKDVYIEFVLTQYSLAPRTLYRNLDNEWIVANSTRSEFMEWLSDQIKQPFTIQEFGNGLYLIHQENK
jgi:hypothetical protein